VKDFKLERLIDSVDVKFKIALENAGLSATRGDPATTDQVLRVARILWDHTVELIKKSNDNH